MLHLAPELGAVPSFMCFWAGEVVNLRRLESSSYRESGIDVFGQAAIPDLA
jgi:hypothetical protein